MKINKIADVFKTIGQPSITYVKRDSGKLEKILNDALNESGQLCLVTGPSKTGKTTLYKEVLSKRNEIPLMVQCDKSKTVAEIWKNILESVDFSRVESKTKSTAVKSGTEGELSGKIGWNWLAEAATRLKGMLGYEQTDGEIRKYVLSEPGPDLLIPILKETNYVLVVEDFHYLEDDQKVLLFQQWKRFIDAEISIIVLGTTHRAVDIANSNKDLLGRIVQIDIGHWGVDDLEKIIHQVFTFLKVEIEVGHRKTIAQESVGLPIVVQQICLQLFSDNNIELISDSKRKSISIKKSDVAASLYQVASTKYAQFSSYYNTLVKGPREKARKYKTYELILACFTLDPIKFSLSRSEIEERMGKLDIPPQERPPTASLNSTLGALKNFQDRRHLSLLEWQVQEEVLYIIEPAFLFYVRWRRMKNILTAQLDFLEILLSNTWSKSTIQGDLFFDDKNTISNDFMDKKFIEKIFHIPVVSSDDKD